MPKKQWTDEERKAFGEKMKLARNNKDGKTVAEKTTTSETKEQKAESVTLTADQFNEMIDRLTVLEQEKKAQVSAPVNSLQVDTFGRPIGVKDRFPLDISLYEDPTEWLYDLPKFARYAMRENYVLKWSMAPLVYENKYGLNYAEPKFELTIARKLRDTEGNPRLDRDTGEPQAAIIGRLISFEDPPRDMQEAKNAGLTPEDVGTPEFSKKMRRYQYEVFITERLNPPRPGSQQKRNKEEVIGGKVYEIENYNTVV